MAKTKKKRQSTRKRKKKSTRRRRKQTDSRLNLMGLVFTLIAIFSIFRWGFLGNLLANTFRLFVGDTYLIAAAIFGMIGLYLLALGHFPDRIPPKRLAGMGLVYLGSLILNSEILFHYQNIHARFLSVVWSLLAADFRRGSVTETVGGGLIGTAAYSGTYFLVSSWGSILLAILMILAGLLLFSGIPLKTVAAQLRRLGSWLSRGLRHLGQNVRTRFLQSDEETATPEQSTSTPAQRSQTTQSSFSVGPEDVEVNAKPKAKEADHESTPEPATTPDQFDVHFTPHDDHHDAATATAGPSDQTATHGRKETTSASAAPEVSSPKTDHTTTKAEQHPDFSDYQLPTPDLLSVIPPVDQSSEVSLIQNNRGVLAKTFQSFGVKVKIIHADLGPTVTKYEVKPGPGVKVNKIVNLADDLALALAAKDIRIEAPIPGKPYVGIEVPNHTIATVSFREVIEKQPQHPDKILEVPLGKSVSGKIMTADLTKMPHLLIAGSTGSGKSVMINVIITSILMHARPDQVKLMLIDPKMVELSVYNDIPHLLLPVVTSPKKAANALNKAVSEMEDRYERFEAAGVRDIKEYNQKVKTNNADKDNPPMTVMPFLVIVIDELADLMMAAGNEVETAIVRLAQKARAAGVHLIIATQRPSVDVITGLIKANIPSRMAFAVSSGVDSRTILDMNGAEKLLGRGDMMFSPLGINKPVRIQGAYISGGDVEKIIDFVKAQQGAEYDQDLIEHINQVDDDEAQDEHDEHYQEAIQTVIQAKKASTSMIQRRFRIGYNRAALIVEDMEKNGIVGPSEGSKGRQVLWSAEDFQRYQEQHQQPKSDAYLS